MSSSKAARFSRTDTGQDASAPSPRASLQVATLVDFRGEHAAIVNVAGKDVTASLLQSARMDIEALKLRPPLAVMVGRISGATARYVVISPAPSAESTATVSPTEKLVLSAESAIELRCGDSLITLTKDGKILIRGVDVHGRAARAYKIKGATVSIN